MFADTLTITVNAVAKTVTKINQDQYSSEYLFKDSTQSISLKIRHTKTKPAAGAKDRHNVELVQTVFATSEAAEIVRKVYVVIEIANSDLDTYLATAMADFLKLTSPAVLTKLNGWES